MVTGSRLLGSNADPHVRLTGISDSSQPMAAVSESIERSTGRIAFPIPLRACALVLLQVSLRFQSPLLPLVSVIAHSCRSQANQQLRRILPLCLRQRFFQLLADSTAHRVGLTFEDTLLGNIHMDEKR